VVSSRIHKSQQRSRTLFLRGGGNVSASFLLGNIQTASSIKNSQLPSNPTFTGTVQAAAFSTSGAVITSSNFFGNISQCNGLTNSQLPLFSECPWDDQFQLLDHGNRQYFDSAFHECGLFLRERIAAHGADKYSTPQQYIMQLSYGKHISSMHWYFNTLGCLVREHQHVQRTRVRFWFYPKC
jgi:hypothetical protein